MKAGRHFERALTKILQILSEKIHRVYNNPPPPPPRKNTLNMVPVLCTADLVRRGKSPPRLDHEIDRRKDAFLFSANVPLHNPTALTTATAYTVRGRFGTISLELKYALNPSLWCRWRGVVGGFCTPSRGFYSPGVFVVVSILSHFSQCYVLATCAQTLTHRLTHPPPPRSYHHEKQSLSIDVKAPPIPINISTSALTEVAWILGGFVAGDGGKDAGIDPAEPGGGGGRGGGGGGMKGRAGDGGGGRTTGRWASMMEEGHGSFTRRSSAMWRSTTSTEISPLMPVKVIYRRPSKVSPSAAHLFF